MEWTCAYKQLIMIILALQKLTEAETKEFYCTREDSWKTTLSTCLAVGGTLMSHRDIADAADVKLKRGTTVWTADYIYWEIVESVPQVTKDYECGYMRFHRGQMMHDFECKYTSSTGVEYDVCSKRRRYTCENALSFDDQIQVHGPDTWFQAYQSCTSPNKLWSGHTFMYYLLEDPQFWVNSARKFTRDTLTGTIPNSRHIVKCGTSEGPVNREGENNCEQRFQAVCILGNTIDDVRFSRSCLQETPTAAPTTTVSTRKTTFKPTRPTTKLTTTMGPSLQSKQTSNGTTSLSTPETPTTTPTTSVSTRQTTLKPTRPTTQLTTTVGPSLQSTQTSNGTTYLSAPETPTTTPTTSVSTRQTTLKPTRPTTQLTTTVGPSLQSTQTSNGTTYLSTPGGLPKTKIIAVASTIIAGIFCCILTVLIYYRKRRKLDKRHSRNVKFKADKQSTSVVLGTNNIPDVKEGARDEADTTAYYEIHLDSKDANNMEALYSDEKHHYDYGYAHSGSENPKPSHSTARRMSILESEYDTTNVKVFNESSNIYNKLGYETPEGVYDSTMSKPSRNPILETNIYSKISPRENLYDTTATAGRSTARLHGTFVSPDGNVYGYTDRRENDGSNLVTGQQFLGTYGDYEIEYNYF